MYEATRAQVIVDCIEIYGGWETVTILNLMCTAGCMMK